MTTDRGPSGLRACSACGARLSRYTDDDHCAPCRERLIDAGDYRHLPVLDERRPRASARRKRVSVDALARQRREFGACLAEMRRDRGWSQEAVARRVGVVQRAVGLWEAGEREPTASCLAGLAAAFGVPMEALWPRGGT